MSNYGGGAIYISSSYFAIDVNGCMFSGNKAVGTNTAHRGNNRVDGGAMYVNASGGPGSSLNIFDSCFEGNFAQDDGGAIIVEGSQSVNTHIKSNISNCTFYGNTAAGAHYGGTRTIGPITITAWCTDGSGGAISYFGLTESEITHSTFYNNGITNALPAGVTGSNFGSAGGGGAIAVDTGFIGDPAQLPPLPKLTNNIFVGNYVTNPMSQISIDLVNSLTGNALGNTTERSKTGNVFVLPITDADSQAPLQGSDPRMLVNNGNIGYDNRSADYTNDGISVSVNVKNIFADYNDTPNRGDVNTALPTEYGGPVGAAGSTVQKKCFIVSPTSNELYRDGSVPYVVEVPYDVLGNKRDTFPNAGAVEIYWSKFDPGIGGGWTGSVPSEVENPNDPSDTYAVVESLSDGYYVMTSSGVQDDPSGYIISMPRSAIGHSDSSYGFLGWRSSIPDLNWTGYSQWAADNSHPEATVEEFLENHPVADLPVEAFPMHQPGNMVLSVKQTFTAIWLQGLYRVDFELNYGDSPNWYSSSEPGKEAPRIEVPSGDAIAAPVDPVRADYVFIGWFKDTACTDRWVFEGDAGTADTVTEDITLYAKWTVYNAPSGPSGPFPNIYYIHSSSDDGSTINPPGTVSVREGGSATFTFGVMIGYELLSVTIDGVEHPELLSVGSYTFSNVSSDHTIAVVSQVDESNQPVFGEGDEGKWSPLNLICAILALAAGIICIMEGRNRTVEGGTDEKRSKTAMILRVVSAVVGVVSIILFFLTEDWTRPMEIVDGWTLVMFILLLISLAAAFVSFFFDKPEKEVNE